MLLLASARSYILKDRMAVPAERRTALTRRDELARARRQIDRQAALEAASRVFARDGLAAPMASISRESGLSLTALYEAFENKDELVAATVDHVYRRNLLPAIERFDGGGADPGRSALALIDQILVAMEADRDYFMFYIEARSGAPEAFDPCVALVIDRITATFERVRAAGLAPGLSPRSFAVALVATLTALAQAQIAGAPDQPITALGPEVHAIFGPLLGVDPDEGGEERDG
jgi:AcrR family transcriptional regulator